MDRKPNRLVLTNQDSEFELVAADSTSDGETLYTLSPRDVIFTSRDLIIMGMIAWEKEGGKTNWKDFAELILDAKKEGYFSAEEFFDEQE